MIIVARGGGSLEDLWTFNEESVVRAIVASRLPVVSAVGHEIDVTLADLAADKRALTPSEAGEFCVPDCREVALHLDRLGDRLRIAGVGRCAMPAPASSNCQSAPVKHSNTTWSGRRHRMARLAASLEALSPLARAGPRLQFDVARRWQDPGA